MLKHQFVEGFADAVFGAMNVEPCIPINPSAPSEGGLFYSDKGVYAFYKPGYLRLCALQRESEYPALVEQFAEFIRSNTETEDAQG